MTWGNQEDILSLRYPGVQPMKFIASPELAPPFFLSFFLGGGSFLLLFFGGVPLFSTNQAQKSVFVAGVQTPANESYLRSLFKGGVLGLLGIPPVFFCACVCVLSCFCLVSGFCAFFSWFLVPWCVGALVWWICQNLQGFSLTPKLWGFLAVCWWVLVVGCPKIPPFFWEQGI